ncbi:hypothetical protein P7C70_g7184, partial [Phenoliferia sp. Uapishka_3]
MSKNAFQTVMSIDTLGTYNTIQATIEEVKTTKGSYIAISATLHYRGTFLQAHVSAAKVCLSIPDLLNRSSSTSENFTQAAIDALFRVTAVECGPFAVRFNIIAPGLIEDTEGAARLLPPEHRAASVRAVPMQRFGVIDDVSKAGIYLFSDAASYVTGAVLIVDGGQYHTSGSNTARLYPDILLEGGDFRKALESKF